MKPINLDARLSSVVRLLGRENIVVDVGCDHGYVANYLVENGLSKLVYATDISEPSLNKNKEFAYSRGNEDKVISVLGNGLIPLVGKNFDAVVIAGMGGELIINILESAYEVIKDKTLILQPMNSRRDLRIYLDKRGFIIEKEDLVKDDDKFYEIIKVNPKAITYEVKSDYYFGESLIRDKDSLLIEYIKELINKNYSFIEMAKKSEKNKAKERIRKLEEEVRLFKEILNDCYK